MKFRCERDVLADALATASRAVSSRGASLPVLSGLRAELIGDRLQLTGSDLDLTIIVSVTVAGQEDGTVVIPAKLASDIVRALPREGDPENTLACVEKIIKAGFDPRCTAADALEGLI